MMYANFTEETCTGTGATLALTGATTGNITFSESFADGDLVAYALEDSGGTILIAGLGTYVSATDDITRDDTWNWNGTVIDDDPSQTNTTLSGGTHTIRCDITHQSAYVARYPVTDGVRFLPSNVCIEGNYTQAVTADRMIVYPYYIESPVKIDALSIHCSAADAGETYAFLGLYKVDPTDGYPGTLVQEVAIDNTTTGDKIGTFTEITLTPGWYFSAIMSDGTPTFSACMERESGLAMPYETAFQTNGQKHGKYTDITSGWTALPTDISAQSYSNQNRCPCPRLRISL